MSGKYGNTIRVGNVRKLKRSRGVRSSEAHRKMNSRDVGIATSGPSWCTNIQLVADTRRGLWIQQDKMCAKCVLSSFVRNICERARTFLYILTYSYQILCTYLSNIYSVCVLFAIHIFSNTFPFIMDVFVISFTINMYPWDNYHILIQSIHL